MIGDLYDRGTTDFVVEILDQEGTAIEEASYVELGNESGAEGAFTLLKNMNSACEAPSHGGLSRVRHAYRRLGPRSRRAVLTTRRRSRRKVGTLKMKTAVIWKTIGIDVD